MTRLQVEALEVREVPVAELNFVLPINGLAPGAFTRIAADNVGNVFVVGNFTGSIDIDPSSTRAINLNSQGGTDIFVARFGFNGQLVWARRLGGAGNDVATDIAFDGAGNVYVCGTYNGLVDFNPGSSPSVPATSAPGGSAFVWKLGFSGNFVMARIPSGNATTATSLAVDPMGNIFVTGNFRGTVDFDPSATATSNLTTTNPNGAAYAWRLNYDGRLTYARAFQTTGLIDTTAIVADGAGNVYLGGSFNGIADLDPGTPVVSLNAGSQRTSFMVKLNFFGNFWWQRTLRNVTPTSANNIVGLGFDNIGNVYASGNLTGVVDVDPSPTREANLTSFGLSDGFVWKTDPNGNNQWARSFGGTQNDTVTDFFMDKFGNSYIVGSFAGVANFNTAASPINLVAGVRDTYVAKFGLAGNLLYARSLGGGTSTTNATGIWADGFGNIYVSGGFSGTANFEPNGPNNTLARPTGAGHITKLSPRVSALVRPDNVPPSSVNAGGPYVILEGQSLTLRGSAVDLDRKPLTYAWDLNGDGVFTDATGATPTLSAAQLVALGLGDNRAPITIRLRVSDGTALPVEATSTLTINNANPTGSARPSVNRVTAGGTANVSVTATDPSATDRTRGLRFSYDFNNDGTWDMGNGTTYAGSVTNSTATIPASVLATPGLKTIKVRIFDKDGGFTDVTTTLTVV